MSRFHLGAWLFLALALVLAAPRARAETYNTCTGFITTLPAVISSQGTWCFKQDLSTAIGSGNAITINTNNVTIDCNNFKLGGLQAGLGTATIGIHALSRVNAVVRHCSIRGFYRGVFFEGFSAPAGGHLVEDNRFDGNTFNAIGVDGNKCMVRRNLVLDTGGTTVDPRAAGIYAGDSADILDNTVYGVVARSAGNGDAYGIVRAYTDGSITGNRIRGVIADGIGVAYGIFGSNTGRLALRNNDLVGDGITASSIGMHCFDAKARAKGNVINGFGTGIDICSDDGNAITP